MFPFPSPTSTPTRPRARSANEVSSSPGPSSFAETTATAPSRGIAIPSGLVAGVVLRCVDRGCLVALEPAPSGRAPSGRAPSEQGDEAPLWTRRAASCLLVPRPGDRVLMTRAPEPFVLAVLERNDAHTEPATLEVEGDMRVRSRGGQLELEGDAGVSVQTRATLELTGRALKVRSEAAEVATEALTAVVRRFRGRLDEAGLVTRTLDTVVERVTQKAARVYRTVTELDQLRARHFDHRADHSARISADNTVVTARQVVKVDGEQVHIG